MNLKQTSLILAAAVTAGFSASTAHAEYEEVVDLAHQLDRQATELRREADRHFRHSTAYKHLVADSNSMIKMAYHLDELAHSRNSNFSHFEGHIDEALKLAEHLHELIEAIEDGRYRGHAHGNTREVVLLSRDIEHTIEDLLDAVDHYYNPRRIARDCPHSGSSRTAYREPVQELSWWERIRRYYWPDDDDDHGHGHHGHSH